MFYIADASAFLNVFDFDFARNTYYTTQLILNEIRDFKNKMIVNHGLSSGHLLVSDPSEDSLKKIQVLKQELGMKLSLNDCSVLALALDFQSEKKDFLLLSDDYSIQNVCFKLKIPFKGVAYNEIKKQLTFQLKCPQCNRFFEMLPNLQHCEHCGSELKRVLKR